MASRMIKVLLVDDSPVVLAILQRMLSAAPDITVAGTAKNGEEALELIPKLEPDVVCSDLHMPKMDGFELTEQIMEKFPRPILVISISVQETGDEHNVFEVLNSGAVDVFPKPRGSNLEEYEKLSNELIRKIRILSGVVVFTKHKSRRKRKSVSKRISPPITAESPIKIVTIGASTGGPQALHKVLTPLPFGFPVPVVCVQHISEGFLKGFVDWLAYECKLKIKIARSGETPFPGTVYFPEERKHLEIDADGKFISTNQPPLRGHRPSVSVTFSSLAKYYGSSILAVLLTGMGSDGAEGMLDIYQQGGITIAQDEYTSTVFGMPKQAIDLGAAKYVLPLEEISSKILKFVKK